MMAYLDLIIFEKIMIVFYFFPLYIGTLIIIGRSVNVKYINV